MQNIPYYPEYNFKKLDSILTIESIVRKLNTENNQYYEYPVIVNYEFNNSYSEKCVINLHKLFIQKCYYILMFDSKLNIKINNLQILDQEELKNQLKKKPSE